jgi:endoglucanase
MQPSASRPTAHTLPRLRGVNLGGWFSQVDAIEEKDPDHFPGLLGHIDTFVGEADFDRIQAWGFNHVRLPVDWFNVFEEATLKPREEVLVRLDKVIASLTARGLFVLFDLHKCPGHDFHDGTKHAQAFFTDPALREQAKQVWSHLAARYRDNALVVLEVLNEPVAPSTAVWNAVKDEMVAHLRREAPHSILSVGSNLWSNAQEFRELTPCPDGNVLYVVHFYSSIFFTHQFASWMPEEYQKRYPYPGSYDSRHDKHGQLPIEGGVWDRARLEKQLEPVIAFRAKHKAPVICNEFGVFVGGADRASQLRWLDDLTDILGKSDIGFSYWNYKNLDFGMVSQGERLFADYPQYQNADRIDFELVDLLRKA